ncbi:ATP-binding protein [Myxococcota bacterium]|nr:ATP-binding protein [Myxococcota bacterium]
MKLTYRLSAALLAVMLVVFTVQAWWRLSGDLATFEEDMRQDHRAMGRALGNAITEVWLSRGPDEALRLLAQTNEREANITIEWVWEEALEAAPTAFPGGRRAREKVGGPPGPGRPWHLADRPGTHRLHTYVPVDVPGPRVGVIHLSESLDAEAEHIRATVLRMVFVTLLLALGGGITAGVVGVSFVGRPVRALVDKARRVGAGDLDHPIAVTRNDEFGVLAREMNTMCDRLAEARRRLDEETQSRLEAVEQLRRADRLMTVGRMAASIAHELGTPLNVVSMRAQMLSEIADEEAGAEAVRAQARSIGEHADQMARIIQQLLNYARPASCDRQRVDVADVVAQTTALLEPVAARQNARLVVEPASSPSHAPIDAAQIQQVLTNLIVNGLQAMAGAGTIRIAVGRARRIAPGQVGETPRPYVTLEVSDEGTGIPREDLPRIFEPFFSTKPTGAGLGLSVMEGIVRDHGGFVEVATAPGHGCTFTVHLPQEDDAHAG